MGFFGGPSRLNKRCGVGTHSPEFSDATKLTVSHCSSAALKTVLLVQPLIDNSANEVWENSNTIVLFFMCCAGFKAAIRNFCVV